MPHDAYNYRQAALMKAVILAGGLGTRISEESHLKPKPMIEIGGHPILWHIMKGFGAHGITDFVICCGYRGYAIKEYFANYFLHMSDVTLDIAANSMEIHQRFAEPWKVTLIDTGEDTATGGRLRRVRDHLDGSFCLTYGDGLCDVDLTQLIQFHQDQGTMATVTAIQPGGRFGAMEVSGNLVKSFTEKPPGDHRWVNGGYFVCQPEVIDLISGDDVSWEREPLETLSRMSQLSCWRHDGFWAAMDTMRDRSYLEALWSEGDPPWRTW